jgi:hypothetical protein
LASRRLVGKVTAARPFGGIARQFFCAPRGVDAEKGLTEKGAELESKCEEFFHR